MISHIPTVHNSNTCYMMKLHILCDIILFFQVSAIVIRSETGRIHRNNCGGVFDGEQLYIRSPNYPDRYPPNLVCYYQINGPQCSKYYKISFLDFELENSEDCKRDRLEIVDQGTLCGKRNGTKRYYANSNGSLHFKFMSNNSTAGKGFSLLIARVSCGNEANEDEQQIISKNIANVSTLYEFYYLLY